MSGGLENILDAVDIETFVLCGDEKEGRSLALQLAESMGLRDAGIVFAEFSGPGARVRVRAYVHRPGDQYAWLRHGKRGGRGGREEEGSIGSAGSGARRGAENDPAGS